MLYKIDRINLHHAVPDITGPTLSFTLFRNVDLRPELLPASKCYKNVLLTRPEPQSSNSVFISQGPLGYSLPLFFLPIFPTFEPLDLAFGPLVCLLAYTSTLFLTLAQHTPHITD